MRPPNEVPLWLKLLDSALRTPTAHLNRVPSHSDEYTSTAARKRLRDSGILPLDEPIIHTGRGNWPRKPKDLVRFYAETENNPAVKGMYMRLAGMTKEKAS